ncbi:DUF1007 family protein [Vibrio sp. WXL103]|uniref:DUF1007 family protein n=1 Tax=unclassified Vibrio TaxID=2614977 RepID=UPI003EC6FDF6
MHLINRTSTRLRSTLLRGFIGCVALSACSFTQAHPHSWIEMRTQVLGQDGLITGLNMQWSFDPMTSMYMLDGEDTSPDNEQATFANLTTAMLENMIEDDFFSFLYHDGKQIKYSPAINGDLVRDRARLVMSFDLPLAQPLAIGDGPLELMIFEPSYYVDMSWRSPQDVTLSRELKSLCSLELVEPNPTPEQMSYAYSLPADAEPDNTLGQLFTQSVHIRCNI